MSDGAAAVATDIVRLLAGYRVPTARESDTQEALARIFAEHGIRAQREHQLGEAGRIDFYLPEARVGVEVKVKGSPTDVLRQVLRYAACDAIAGLVLVTARARVAAIPEMLQGKPVRVAQLWKGLL